MAGTMASQLVATMVGATVARMVVYSAAQRVGKTDVDWAFWRAVLTVDWLVAQ